MNDGVGDQDNEEVLFVDSTEIPQESTKPDSVAIDENGGHETEKHDQEDEPPAQATVETEPLERGSQLPRLDPVQLASILKDFTGSKDPLFEGSPEYMAVIVKEMLETDFLLVLGRGLGLAQILKLFLAKVKQASSNALVFVLGRRKDEEDESDEGMGNDRKPQASAGAGAGATGIDDFDEENTIGFGVNAEKRAKLYNKGGTYHITAPIAVVDILTGVLDCSTVSGLVIAHGESIKEQSMAAFFIRLLREQNPTAFIKAMSDTPERLLLPPALPQRLRTLGVKTVMLWPRFHLAVDRSLPRLEVEEIIVEQSSAVRKQQALLTELMQAVLSDVKRRVPHLDVDFLAPTLGPQQPHENPDQLHAMTTADAVLAAPDLPWRIRNALQGVWHQLSRDGKRSVHSLGTLQQLQHTLIEFDALSFWSQLDLACRDTSEPWVILPAADALIAEARREATFRRLPGKFSHLRSLIESFEPGRTALVLCESPKTVMELYEYFSRSDAEQTEDEMMLKAMEESMRKADEEKARIRAAEHAAKVNEGRPGRRRVRGGKAPSPGRDASRDASRDAKQEITQDPATQDAEQLGTPEVEVIAEEKSNVQLEPARVPLKRKYEEEIDLTNMPDDNASEAFSTNFPSVRAHVLFATYRSSQPLQVVKPDHIVMYDPSLYFTREVERYVATLPASHTPKPTVHFMYYQKSVEELRYLTEMRREKDAFTRLIREKGLMPMVLRDGDTDSRDDADTFRLVGSSRRNYQVSKAPQTIVVDTREFRSALPFLIWQSRINVKPVTLLVGDYILTPDIVVERKSITDLIGSFRDGRLYAQCESMQRHYKIAVLLIEFDNLTHFSMEPFKDIRSRQNADVQREIQDNITALLLRFPKLKLVWSASPFHSAQIFKGLKEMEPEPEPEECAKAGHSVMFDSVALSMLEALPGVTPGNSHLLARKATTIEEICELSRQDIVDAIGPENGDKLYRFITIHR